MSFFARQPLLQFLVGGLVLYVALAVASPDSEPQADDRVIIVDDASLLTFLQFQDKAFDEAQARAVLDGLDTDSRSRLIDEFVRDEIMVREALSLGLDENDDVIRQRLIQKMDFIFQGFEETNVALSPDEIEEYFEGHRDRYQQQAHATFTHVFVNARDRDRAAAKSEAQALLEQLNEQQVPLEEAGRYGDRFFFLRNYVDRSEQLIIDHFGAQMAAKLFSLDPSDQWVGPFSSQYGEHLVMLRNRVDARALTLDEVRQDVVDDLLRTRRDAARRKAYEERARRYSVETQLSWDK